MQFFSNIIDNITNPVRKAVSTTVQGFKNAKDSIVEAGTELGQQFQRIAGDDNSLIDANPLKTLGNVGQVAASTALATYKGASNAAMDIALSQASVYTPDFIENPIKKAVGKAAVGVADTSGGQWAGETIQSFKEKHPTAAFYTFGLVDPALDVVPAGLVTKGVRSTMAGAFAASKAAETFAKESPEIFAKATNLIHQWKTGGKLLNAEKAELIDIALNTPLYGENVLKTFDEAGNEVVSTAKNTIEDNIASLRDKIRFSGEASKLDITSKAKIPLKVKVDEGITTSFAPLSYAEKQILGKSPDLKMGDRFELSSSFKGNADNLRNQYINELSKLTRDAGDAREMSTFLTLKRIESRLQFKNGKVGDWTPEKVSEALQYMKGKIGDANYFRYDQAMKTVQKYTNTLLNDLEISGMVDKKTLDKIREVNKTSFYLPFNVQRAADETVDVDLLLKRMEGIEDEAYELIDPLETFGDMLSDVRVKSLRNQMLQDLLPLADIDEGKQFIGRFPNGVPPSRRDWVKVEVKKDGLSMDLYAEPSLAKAITGLNKAQVGLVTKALSPTKKMLSAGATAYNIGFVPVSFIYNVKRLAELSKYGIKSPKDAITFINDISHGVVTGLVGNLDLQSPTVARFMKDYQNFIQSGAGGSTIQKAISPAAKKPLVKSVLRNVLDTPGKLTSALEESTKIASLRRGMRELNKQFGVGNDRINQVLYRTNPEYRDLVKSVEIETRRYGGSPDFLRMGTNTKEINHIFMFFNAAYQGNLADVTRLTRDLKTPAGRAAATRTAILQSAVMMNAVRNQLYYKDDLEQVPEWEKENNFMIASNQFFINDSGQRVREFYRIPKREASRFVGNVVERLVDGIANQSPEAFREMALGLLEDVSPVRVDLTSQDGTMLQNSLQSLVSSVNPAIKLPIEAGFNLNTFANRPIESEAELALPPSERVRSDTRLSSQVIAKGFDAVGADTLASPIMTQHLIDGATGGFFKTLEPSQGIASRNPLSRMPVTNKFFRSQFVEEGDRWNIIKQWNNQAKGETTVNYEWAEKKVNEIVNAPTKADKLSVINALAEQEKAGTINKDQIKAFKNVMSDTLSQVSPIDRKLRSFAKSGTVKNGEFAQKYYTEMLPLEAKTADEAKQRILDLYQKKIINDTILQQIIVLATKDKWQVLQNTK